VDERGNQHQDRAQVWEERLNVPVLIAAGASVPAVFLERMPGFAGTVGTVLNYASMLVLTAESVLLLVLSAKPLAWLRKHWWTVLVALLSVLAVVFAVGPAQLLRAARVASAVQLLRVSRLLKAARILHRRRSTFGRFQNTPWIAVTTAAALFALLLLADSTAVQCVVEDVLDCATPGLVVAALFGATAVVGLVVTALVLRRRGRD